MSIVGDTTVLHIAAGLSLILLPFLLYAEIHYHPKLLKGYLYIKQPEIIFDAPHRIETEQLPVLLLIKDSDMFPIILKRVTISVGIEGTNKQFQKIFTENQALSQRWFGKIYSLDVSRFMAQHVTITCRAEIQQGQTTKCIDNDNYRTLSQRPFRCYIDPDPLPAEKDWLWGDLHCHSHYTEDQVEFGTLPRHYSQIGRAMGLRFVAISDHSFDMDDVPGTWTQSDPRVGKWQTFWQQINRINAEQQDFLIIPGEELSVDNGLGRNVHMSILNHPDFFHGSGDGLEISWGRASEHHYREILDRLPAEPLVFASHPQDKPPILHRIFIKRGVWNTWDHNSRLDGYQIMNGKRDHDFRAGKKTWIKQLLRKRRLYIYAGNDAHGNFNRLRTVYLPLIRLREFDHQVFGRQRTGVFCPAATTPSELVHALKKNPVIVSNGPFCNIGAMHPNGKTTTAIGQELNTVPDFLRITAKSSPYYGRIKAITVFRGDPHTGQEQQWQHFEPSASIYHFDRRIPLRELPAEGYFRAEVITHKQTFTLTNPIWIKLTQ